MSNCNFNTNNKVLLGLFDELGDNNNLAYAYLAIVSKGFFVDAASVPVVEFNPQFSQWFNAKHGVMPNYSEDNKVIAKNISKGVIEYCTTVYKPDVESFTSQEIKSSDQTNLYGYTDDYTREYGKTLLAGNALTLYNNVVKLGTTIWKEKRSWFEDSLIKDIYSNLKDAIINRTKADEAQLAEEFKAYCTEHSDDANNSYLANFFTDKIDLNSATEKNLYAMLCEATGSFNKQFFDDIFYKPELNSLLSFFEANTTESKDEQADGKNIDAQGDLNGQESKGDDSIIVADSDVTIQQYDHLGQYASFITHITSRLKDYFNALPLTNDTGEVDRNNVFGMAERLNANLCSTILYNNCNNFSNLTDMIEQIRNIANTVPGFKVFKKFADDLTSDLDFATEVARVFAKTKVARLQIEIKNGNSRAVQSNLAVNKQVALSQKLMLDIKASALESILDNTIEAELINFNNTFSNVLTNQAVNDNTISNLLDNELTRIIPVIESVCTQLFPSLDSKSILAYIECANNASSSVTDKVKNVQTLMTLLCGIREGAMKAKENFEPQRIKAKQQNEINKALKEARKNDTILLSRAELLSQNEFYKTDYIPNETYAKCSDLAAILSPYCVVDTELNSPNAMHNNKSSIVNNSWIAQINKIMEESYTDNSGNLRNDKLEKWGERKLKSKQYTHSTLLLEQYDKYGKPINKAIFRRIKGQLCLTEHAKNIMQIFLFDGVTNNDTDTSILYNKMTTPDFLPTAYTQFFNISDQFNRKLLGSQETATYFLRIPSDASNIMAVQGTRYMEAQNVIHWETESGNKINEVIPTITKEDFQNKYNKNGVIPFSSQQEFKTFSRLINNPAGVIIDTTWYRAMRKVDNTEANYYLPIQWEKGNNKVTFILNVEVEPQTIDGENVYVIKNSQPIGKYVNEKSTDINPEVLSDLFPEEVSKPLQEAFDENSSNQVVSLFGQNFYKKVDRTNRMFLLAKEQFKQEMLNAAIAREHYFTTDNDGWVIDSSTNSKTANKEIKLKEGTRNDKGYEFYHLGKKGLVLEKTNKGVYYLDGKVFHSNKFVLSMRDAKGNEYERNFMDELIEGKVINNNRGCISLLYGGTDINGKPTDNYLHVIKNQNGEVTDVKFTPAQEQAIDAKLEEFFVAYYNQAMSALRQYKNVLQSKNTYIHTTSVQDFAFNYLITLMQYDDLLEGETKFYKDSQTILKRAKEYQASGVPYGIFDLNSDPNGEPCDVAFDCYLNSNEIQNGILKGIRQRDKFYGLTIKNSKMTNEPVLEQLVTKLVKQGLPEAKARDILFGPEELNEKTGKLERRGGFQNQKVNDAQSYITFEEWVRRIAGRGQLKQYLPLIEKIMDKNSVLTADEITEFVQVQKNIYYDLWYDPEYGIEVPRQIKNAELVLVPRFIEGTDLQKVYDFMKETGVDQLNTVETSKAANEEVLTFWDNDCNLQELNDELKNKVLLNKKPFSYNNLYTQQETPQHLNAANKMGIQIMKKIIDNIPKGHKLYNLKEEYFTLFVHNIRLSYESVMDSLDVPRDKFGNIILDEQGNIVGLNKQEFFEKLKDELVRFGLDDNVIKYVTTDEQTGEPICPPVFNDYITKFESVIQASFNRKITRQSYKGFHAAQVTNVGWKFEKGKGQIEKNKLLKYHPNKKGEPSYIEIMLPASNFGIDLSAEHYNGRSEEDIIKELETKGLDKVIGYRIPTEGKQSMAIMKVVGFIPDGMGSTIVVPNEWVGQSGSDFDIDSIYGIQFECTKSSTGEINKIKYVDKSKDVSVNDYFRYVLKNTVFTKEEKDEFTKIKSEIKDTKTKLNSEFSETMYSDLNGILSTQFNKIPKPIQKQLIKFSKQSKSEDLNYSNRENYITYLNNYGANIKPYYNMLYNNPKIDNNILKELAIYLNTISDIIDFLNGQGEVLDKLLKLRSDYSSKLDALAKANGLLSFNDYKAKFDNLNERHLYNSAQSCRNRVVDIMMQILGDSSSLEENLMRSNFDDIIYWRNQLMDVNEKQARAHRSPYNIFSQISYQNDAISGLQLKGMSVFMDTFCSICNTVRPTLSDGITVEYDVNSFTKDDLETLKLSYPDAKIKNNKIILKHNRYGWSETNRNVAGKLLTAYSSQTTAHILDAIKEGNIPNVDMYTFMAYKTLVNIGCDYKTAIAFIMQPAITKIVNNNNSTKSCFATTFGNPIETTIRDLAKTTGLSEKDIKDKPLDSLLGVLFPIFDKKEKIDTPETDVTDKEETEEDEINETGSVTQDQIRIANILGVSPYTLKAKGIRGLSRKLQHLPLNPNMLADRLKNQGVFEKMSESDKALFDIVVALQFDRINKIAGQIGSIARCCNPDKFGAKQSVFETNQVFYNIIDEIGKDRPILKVDGKNILEAIYPGMEKATYESPVQSLLTGDNSKKSKYPILYGFLKYASATSTLITRQLLPTQNREFARVIENFSTVLSPSTKLNTDTYTDVQKYFLSYFYNSVPSIAHPVKYDVANNKWYVDTESSADDERSRIFGYGHTPNTNVRVPVKKEGEDTSAFEFKAFTCDNILAPTQEEINAFCQLSPAQKVQWIKTNFAKSGILKTISCSLYNGENTGYRQDTQTMRMLETSMSKNAMLAGFRKLFFNSNPLVKLTAIDIIKYYVQVDGMRMAQTGIGKIIDISALINSFNEESCNGIGFTDNVMERINTIGTKDSVLIDNKIDENEETLVDNIYERYLRSHESVKGISTIRPNSYNRKRYKMSKLYGVNEMYRIPFLEGDDSYKNLLIKAGLIYSTKNEAKKTIYLPNQYVRMYVDDYSNKTALYKINNVDGQLFLYPLNGLQPNETYEWSANPKYYLFEDKDFYKAILKEIKKQTYNTGINNGVWMKTLTKLREEADARAKTPHGQAYNKDFEAISFDINELAKTSDGMARVKTNILTYWNNYIEQKASLQRHIPDLYINSGALSHYIFSEDLAYGSEQIIETENGTKIWAYISKVKSDVYRKYLAKQPDGKNKGKRMMSDDKFDKAMNGYERRLGVFVKPEIDNPYLRDIIIAARNNNLENVNIYQVKMCEYTEAMANANKINIDNYISPEEETPGDGTAYNSALDENNYNLASFVDVEVSRGNESAIKMVSAFKKNKIQMDAASFKANKDLVTRQLSNFLSTEYNSLKVDYDNFIADPDMPGKFLSITDPKVQELLKGNRQLQNKYMSVINKTKALIEQYSVYKGFELEAEDKMAELYVNQIKATLQKVEELPYTQAEQNFAEGYVKTLSTDPNIMSGMVAVMNAYHATYGCMWRFNDILESGNSLLQIMLKDVMGDLDAKKKASARLRRDVKKKIKAIITEAANNGIKLSINDVIDENGNLIQKYTQDFVDDYNKLNDAVAEAASTYGLGSLEHLRAKHDLDYFKYKYFNQEAVDAYYEKLLRLEEDIMNSHPKLYEAYMKLYYKKLEILADRYDTGLTDEQREKLAKIEDDMMNLYRLNVYKDSTGKLRNRIEGDPNIKYSEKMQEELDMWGQYAASKLNEYIEAVRTLKNKVITYDAEVGFDNALKINLSIIDKWEDKDINGVRRTPQAVLDASDEYKRAVNWIRDNATYVLKQTESSAKDPNSLMNKLTKAFKILRLNSTDITSSQIGRIIRDAKAKDIHGVTDGTQLSEEDIKKIKQLTENNYNIAQSAEGSDRILIKNASPITTKFSKEFYKKMKSNGDKNVEYLNIVHKINEILIKYYDDADKIVHLERIPQNEDGKTELRQLIKLYGELKDINKTDNQTNKEVVKRFIKEHVKFETNDDLYQNQNDFVAYSRADDEFKRLFRKVTSRLDDYNEIVVDDNNNPIPNSFLYSFVVPKGDPSSKEYQQFIADDKVSEAADLVSRCYKKETTLYYRQKRQEMMTKSTAEYHEWFANNHVLNPVTGQVEPLPCWLTSQFAENILRDEVKGTWEPKGQSRVRTINEQFANDEYHQEKGLFGNFKDINDSKYSSSKVLNKYELELRDYLQDLFVSTSSTNKARHYFETGHMPAVGIDTKSTIARTGLEIGKLMGFDFSKSNNKEFYNEIGYSKDLMPTMPLTEMLWSEKEGSVNFNEPEPDINDVEAHTAWEEKKAEADKKNREVHKKLMNRDWDKVIDEYLDRASWFNAVQDNKERLYFLHNVLKNQKVYSRSRGLTGGLKQAKRRRRTDNIKYETHIDNDLVAQYETFMKRLIYDQWKENEGKLTTFANKLQNFTSANYMMLNLKGGLANVTLGSEGMFMEGAAKTYFKKLDLAAGMAEWHKGTIGFVAGMYTDTAINKQDAITKYCHVVDFDEVIHSGSTFMEFSKNVRNFMFSPQTIGEHFMQNSVLFAMLKSHKIVPLLDDSLGIGYTYMNEREYVQYKLGLELNKILTPEQREAFEEFKKAESSDPNTTKDYAWFRKNLYTEFIRFKCTKEQREAFREATKKKEKEYVEEFKKLENIYDQMELGEDGYLTFRKGSIMETLSLSPVDNNEGINKADSLMGHFSRKVISVNKSIHGVYDRLGRAYIEQKWYGSLIMQYHKHLPMGLLKRYRLRGYYNETRGSVEKGMWASLYDFLSLDIRGVKADNGWTDENVKAMYSLQNLLKFSWEFLTNMKETWRYMPEYDKANMRRELTNVLAILGAVSTVIALMAIGDDDDSIPYNFALYEANRLATESFMYDPVGLWTETKTLMSTPIAGLNVIGDGFMAIQNILKYMFGDEESLYYQSGRFAGENRLLVYLKRRTPIYNGVRGIIELPKNNRYYREGETAITLVPTKDIAEDLQEIID